MRPNPDLDWLDGLADMQNLRVPGVLACESKELAGTRDCESGVPGVPEQAAGTRGTQRRESGVPPKSLQIRKEHAEHPEHSKAEGIDGNWGLTPDLASSLRLLEQMPPPPRVNSREVWGEVVRDAMCIARDGWAATAIDLGWDAADLFATGPNDDGERDCLAIWLAGRRLSLLTEWTARTTSGAMFYREEYMRATAPRAEPVWLWQFGRDVRRG